MRKALERLAPDNNQPETRGDTRFDAFKTHAVEPFYPSAPMRINDGTQSPTAHPEENLQRNINRLHNSYGNISTLRYFNYHKSVQPKLKTDQAGDALEQEADGAAENVIESGHTGKPKLSPVGTTVQRSPAEGSPATAPPSAATQTPPTAATTPIEETRTATPGFLVDDSAKELIPGQMRKSEFLGRLRDAVCATAEAALSGTIWSAMGCPWIDHWFGYYGGRDAQSIERAIQRYAPGASGVASAADYIPFICARVGSAVAQWSATGEVKGVPEGVPTGLPGMPSSTGEGSPASSSASVSLKAREGGAPGTADPQAVQAQLNSGRSLDSGVRSQMESAFGQDFSGVRVHTDSKAGRLSEDLHARAFTVGRDVAFASGEYKPGTLIGDALIAHELAHVVQQGGGATTAPMQKGDTESGVLEEDADMSAVVAVTSFWSGMKTGFANIARNAVPRLRSGLKLQGCKKKPKNLVIEHMSGSTHEVPGISAGETEFGATGLPTSLLKSAPPGPGHPITGGFSDSVSLEIGFGTGTRVASGGEINAMIAAAGSRIDAQLLPAITEVAQDKYILTALKSFLERDQGKFVAWNNDSGHYDGMSPPTIAVGITGGLVDIRTTLVHELFHYVFDKSDSILAEAKDTGGADHSTIEALEAKFLIIYLIRSGKPPLHEKLNTAFGGFLKSGDIFPQMEKAISDNDKTGLSELVDKAEFVTTVVSSGLLGEASTLGFPENPDEYRYTPEQFKDLAFLWAQNAAIVRHAMKTAALTAKKLNVPLSDVFARSEWKDEMSKFLNSFVTELQKNPKQGAVSLERRL